MKIFKFLILLVLTNNVLYSKHNWFSVNVTLSDELANKFNPNKSFIEVYDTRFSFPIVVLSGLDCKKEYFFEYNENIRYVHIYVDCPYRKAKVEPFENCNDKLSISCSANGKIPEVTNLYFYNDGYHVYISM